MKYCSLKRWYVFYTYPKFEKKIHDCLIKENHEVFLPMHWVVRQWSDRKKRLCVPMFPNYLFVYTEYSHIFEILNTPKVICCVKFNKQPTYLRQKEIDCIKNIIETDYQFEVSSNLQVGDFITITDGPLTGLEGTLVEERGNHRFGVRISSLNQSILIDVPCNCIKALKVATY